MRLEDGPEVAFRVELDAGSGGVGTTPALTPDGRYLLYRTSCRYSSCPSKGQGEIRRYDRLTNTTKRVSVNNSGVESNGGDAVASISAIIG